MPTPASGSLEGSQGARHAPAAAGQVVRVDGVEERQVALRREAADELLSVVLEVVADGVRAGRGGRKRCSISPGVR